LKTSDERFTPPDDAIEALARRLYPVIVAFFESDEGKREFAEWKVQQGVAAEAQPEII
jgi:hypothetical protein